MCSKPSTLYNAIFTFVHQITNIIDSKGRNKKAKKNYFVSNKYAYCAEIYLPQCTRCVYNEFIFLVDTCFDLFLFSLWSSIYRNAEFCLVHSSKFREFRIVVFSFIEECCTKIAWSLQFFFYFRPISCTLEQNLRTKENRVPIFYWFGLMGLCMRSVKIFFFNFKCLIHVCRLHNKTSVAITYRLSFSMENCM